MSDSSNEIKLAVVGSRNFKKGGPFKNPEETFNRTMKQVIEKLGKMPDLIISGGAPGADTLAEKWAAEHKIKTKIFPADWAKYGKSAGPKRNTEIVNAATHLLAFLAEDSVGTRDSIKKAEDREIRVFIRNI